MSVLLDKCRPIRGVKIRGKVALSRVHKRIEGDELRAINDKRREEGLPEINFPYFYLIIDDPEIINADEIPQEVADYFSSKIVSLKKDDQTTLTRYHAISKVGFIPVTETFMNRHDDKHVYTREVRMFGELAQGLDVTVGACIYDENGRLCVGFDQVFLNEIARFSNLEAETALNDALCRLAKGEKL